ncbi:DNA polymerase III subunit alpha [Cycloclasticus pugetii]|uniref:DNA polymerase III subunit alpha n=1 Tax=Cycloclasticus pugetii TaxID=34068 RepID=UPI0009203445|nr:DNA polymerase III subunit alpha [Cycloclasticus pugetii]SHJ35129.1 DNA polymerase III, alpha subunit [Cycloclasticus pugetii]
MSEAIKFIHLRNHTEYSLVDGIIRVKPLVKRVAELAMPAIGVTDQSNLFATVKFYRAALAAGIKPIIGADVQIRDSVAQKKPYIITLLAQNQQGYLALCELISEAYLNGQDKGVAYLTSKKILEKNEGLIALSGCLDGLFSTSLQSNDTEQADTMLSTWLQVFKDRFYIELQRIGRSGEAGLNNQLLALASKHHAPIVATNSACFLKPEEFDAHEARVCINQGRVLSDTRRVKTHTEQQYLKSQEDMLALFSDLPEALENTVEIAKRCNVELSLGENFLPDFPVPKGMTIDEYFADLSQKGLDKRIQETSHRIKFDDEKRAQYQARLKRELDVICQMGFPGYFLIVADFIQWAKDNGVPVGPGRGSGAGSIIAYALRITDLDPLEFDLLFERFLNPERVSMPDFDVDFCMDGRDGVIDYVGEKYGRDKVSQIITYGSMAAKAVIRDVGRVLGHPYGFVDRLAKAIPFEIGMTLTKALDESPDLLNAYKESDEVRELIDLALMLEGVARNAGKHAGGVVIAPSKLTDFSPLYCEEGGANLVTQFDKDDIEAVGLVKFDFLGLRTLTIIDWALQNINQRLAAKGEEAVNIDLLPRDDELTYELLKNYATTAVFQLESRGMKDLIRRLRPDTFEDIIALVALFRPGPLQSGMVDDYINVKHGRKKAEYPHPTLIPILEPTNGVILYQEQVMQIAQDLAGYSLGSADLLRRAMGKKKPEEMAKQREMFTTGAVANNVEESVATYIFDLMEKFAGYGFNKSHSAAYALIAYQTAWLKAHYPSEFMAAVLSSDMDNTDKVVLFIDECRDMGLNILPPDVNSSYYRFTTNEEGDIIYGLGALKGVGEGAIESIIQQRELNGPYSSHEDLANRIDLRKANRRVQEALIRAGALDCFDTNRAQLMQQLTNVLQVAEQQGKSAMVGQNDLFGVSLVETTQKSNAVRVKAWSEHERLKHEKTILGLYLTGHPFDTVRDEMSNIVSGKLAALHDMELSSPGGGQYRRAKGKPITVSGLVLNIRTRPTKSGAKIATIILDDGSARMEAVAYSEVFETYSEQLQVEQIVVIEGSISFDDFAGQNRISIESVMTVEQARKRFIKDVLIELDADVLKQDNKINQLHTVLSKYRGGDCPVKIKLTLPGASSALLLPDEWHIKPEDALLTDLHNALPEQQGFIRY